MIKNASARSCGGFGDGGLSMCSRSDVAVQQFAKFLLDSSSRMFMEFNLHHNTAASFSLFSRKKLQCIGDFL